MILEAELTVISGGLFVPAVPGEGLRVGDGNVIVHGSGLTLSPVPGESFSQLSGLLADGSPIDLPVFGNVQNITLVPEPGTGVAVSLGLVAVAARRSLRMRARAGA
jgi:hypothetical protein